MKKTIFILFFMVVSLETSAVDSQSSIDFLQKPFLVENTNNEIPIKSNRDQGSSQLEKENKKPVSGESATYDCSEVWTDKFSPGYIQLGSKCNPKQDVCIAFFHVERNYCEGDKLIRLYCDPTKPSMYSEEKIICEKGCGLIDYYSACIK